jgi:hypothetical protein
VFAGGGADIVSFFCAQAPKLSAPAATVTIIIILTNFTLNLASFPFRLLRTVLDGEPCERNEFLVLLLGVELGPTSIRLSKSHSIRQSPLR